MSTISSYLHRAKEARRVYETNNGNLTDIGTFLSFYIPPACEHGDERIANALGTTKRRGDFLYRNDKTYPFAHITDRPVFGLDVWLAGSPKRERMQVVIKNPRGVEEKDTRDVLGVRSALVVY